MKAWRFLKMRSFSGIACLVSMTLALLAPGHAQLSAAQAQLPSPAALPSASNSARVSESPPSMPLLFIENTGQFDPRVRFQVHSGGATLYLAENALWLSLLERSEEGEVNQAQSDTTFQNENREGVNLKISFVGANPHPRLEPFNPVETHLSYLIGNDATVWHTDVPIWGGVRYVDLYPGLDFEITSENGQLVQRLAVREGGLDPQLAIRTSQLSDVRLCVDGAEALSLDGGWLRLSTELGEFRLPLLDVTGAVDTSFESPTILDDEVTWPFASAGSGQQLAIPSAQSTSSGLLYSTFLGGSYNDCNGPGSPCAIAVDGAGNAYITGPVLSADFPTTVGAFDTGFNGTQDAFVVKLNTTGTELVYATFLGGGANDSGHDIAVDEAGNVYVTGDTSSLDFPFTSGALDESYNGGMDGFVVKLNTTGTGLVYATFLGESGGDAFQAIAIDETGSAYVSGYTYSPNFPTTDGAFDRTYNGGGDTILAKLNSDGTALIYSTFLGGTDYDLNYGIAVDGEGSAYLTGWTWSLNFPTTVGAFDENHNGGWYDAFVVKLDPTQSGTASLIYSTYLGGIMEDEGSAIAVDGEHSAYVTGWTSSSDFPTTTGENLNGISDVFIVKLNADGTERVYATLLGGSEGEGGMGITVDGAGSAYVAGYTTSSDFPTTADAFDTSFNAMDAFLVKVDSGGTGLVYSTFLGGSNLDRGYEVAVDGEGSAYVVGDTQSTDFPTTQGACDGSYNGNIDAFVAKLGIGNITTYSISGQITDSSNNPISGVTVSAGSGGSATTGASGVYTITGVITGTYTLMPSKNGYTFTPISRTVSVPPNASGQSFTGTIAWTLMFYLDGDNDLDATYPPIFNVLEAAADNPNVQVVAAWDRLGDGNSAYYKIQYDLDPQRLATYTATVNYWPQSELNMGITTTVVNFVNWSRTNYPGQHYALILSDHGSGLGGGMRDDSTNSGPCRDRQGHSHDCLTVNEIGAALASATYAGTNKMDVLYMDACLMGMIEDAYQIRNYVDYYVASENLQWAYNAPYFQYVSGITANTAPAELAELFVTSYANVSHTKSNPYTISAVDISGLNNVVSATNSLAQLLNSQMTTSAITLTAIRSTVQRFEMNGDDVINPSDDYIDLYHFAELAKSNFLSDNGIQTAAQSVMDAINAYVIREHHLTGITENHTWDLNNSHGVSIFFPSRASSFYSVNNYEFAVGAVWPTAINFSSGSSQATIAWGTMLIDYFQVTQPGGPDNPIPPQSLPRLWEESRVYLPFIIKR